MIFQVRGIKTSSHFFSASFILPRFQKEERLRSFLPQVMVEMIRVGGVANYWQQSLGLRLCTLGLLIRDCRSR